MDKNHLKLIIKNLKMVIEELESEVYSDPSSYTILEGGHHRIGLGTTALGYADQEEL